MDWELNQLLINSVEVDLRGCLYGPAYPGFSEV